MLVSIIITSYNYERYLAQAIESALHQDHPHVEVIVVDDGSTDGSARVIEQYADRVTAINKENGGQCSCFNVGFARSRGDVVIFLDADDVLLPHAASLHSGRLSGGAVKSCGYTEVIDSEGRRTGSRIPRQLPESGDYLRETLENGLDAYQTSFTSGHAWSRAFLEQTFPIPENDIIGADGYLTAIDRLFGRLEFIHEPVALYRLHTDNKGPVSFRFEQRHMENRVRRKQHRMNYAERWLDKLGHEGPRSGLRQIRDWRLTLMMHSLRLLDERHASVPLSELVMSPFRTRPRRLWASTAVAACLLVIHTLPKGAALELARRVLTRTQDRRVGERRPADCRRWRHRRSRVSLAVALWRSSTTPSCYPLLAFGIPIVILLVAWAGSLYSGRPMSEFMRDTAAVADVPAYTGLVSNIGGLLWAGASTLALVTTALLAKAGRRDDVVGFFAVLGLLSAALMADDVFMLHDWIFPYFLGLPEWLPVAFHAALLLVLLIRFRALYMQWNLFFLVIALGGFAGSVGIDALPDDSLPAHYVIEDGLKLLGIVNWLAFTAQCCFRYLRVRASANHHALDDTPPAPSLAPARALPEKGGEPNRQLFAPNCEQRERIVPSRESKVKTPDKQLVQGLASRNRSQSTPNILNTSRLPSRVIAYSPASSGSLNVSR